MKTLLKIAEMIDHGPTWLKDAASHVAKDAGLKTDDLELHRHSHSEKAAVNGLDPKSRRALKYVSYRTQDRDDEIVIPETISLTEFKKYGHVLVNHNYSLLPVGSDVDISADDYGIKALTEYADTGAGTLANVVWALVSQGHLKSSSIGFVPTSFTKPGARDWDHVANQLQSNWKEFDKSRAEKSISRIITGGVLLEHSDVSVPCNADAELISVCKSMHMDGKVAKQLGWEMKDGIIVKAFPPAEPVPCACDECGFVADAVVGSKCPECKTGDMKPKGKEKAIEVSDKGGAGSGNFDHEGRPGERGGSGEGGGNGNSDRGDNKLPSFKDSDLKPEFESTAGRNAAKTSSQRAVEFSSNAKADSAELKEGASSSAHDNAKESHLAASRQHSSAATYFSNGSNIYAYHKEQASYHDRQAVKHDSMSVKLEQAGKGFHSRTIEKPNPHMPGGSFTACVAIMEGKGHDNESAKKICGALQADAGGKGLTQAETKAVREVTGKALPLPCTCDECGAEAECAPNSACQEPDCEGTMVVNKKQKAEKAVTEIKIVRPAPSVKVLFVPPSGSEIAQRVGEAVEKALSRRTGKIM